MTPDEQVCELHPTALILRDGSCEAGCAPRRDPHHSQVEVEAGQAAHPAPERYDRNGVPSLYAWKTVLYERAKGACDALIRTDPLNRELLQVTELETFIESVNKLRPPGLPAGLTAIELDEEAETIARALQKIYALPAVMNGNGAEPGKPSLVVIENREGAAVMNAEYLARPEIIERLGYSQSIALMIGGKHHGKTTNIRTLALSVARGLQIWGRGTTQGPVIYAASDDELASTRNELLRMGWTKDDPLTLAHINYDVDAEKERILDEIGGLALRQRAILIILDMLFDFIDIRDELSYAGTRSAINPLQKMADETKCLVVPSHHTPKYLNDAHNAANAALGSQGISARFSPIILTRKWADNLFTVESTTVRDPRGETLRPMKIIKNGEGWIETAGEFKEWMKWEIYAQKVLDLFENPQRGLSVFSIAEKLGLDRSRVQNTVKELTGAGKLRREKQGRSFCYYLGSSSMFERQGGNWNADNKDN